MELKNRFKNTYKEVLVNKEIVKGTALGLLIARVGNKERSTLELIGIASLVHLTVSGVTTAAMIGIDVDEYFVDNSDDF